VDPATLSLTICRGALMTDPNIIKAWLDTMPRDAWEAVQGVLARLARLCGEYALGTVVANAGRVQTLASVRQGDPLPPV